MSETLTKRNNLSKTVKQVLAISSAIIHACMQHVAREQTKMYGNKRVPLANGNLTIFLSRTSVVTQTRRGGLHMSDCWTFTQVFLCQKLQKAIGS